MEFLELFYQKIEGITISSAESVTGGNFASILTSENGSSKYFKGGVVTYSNKSKEDILGVNIKNGVINNLVAIEMAESVNKLIPADLSIAFTGNAGSRPVETTKTGTSFIAITYKGETKSYKFISTKQDRDEIIWETVTFGMRKIIDTV